MSILRNAFGSARGALRGRGLDRSAGCLECSIKNGLELAYAVSMIEASRLLAISERDFGVKFESFTFPEYIGGFSPEEFDETLNLAEVGR